MTAQDTRRDDHRQAVWSAADQLQRPFRAHAAASVDDQLAAVLVAERQLAAARHQLVAQLRQDGWSWTRVGALLNISKQAAAKTYGDSSEVEFRAVMREARREISGQVTVSEAVAEVEGKTSCPSCGNTYDNRAMWVRDGDAVCYLCQRAAAEGTSSSTATTQVVAGHPCQAPVKGGCGNTSWDDSRLCDHHAAELDEMTDDQLSVPLVGWGAVHCPECRVEPGETCRTMPTYWPTRGKRPHGKRLRLAQEGWK